MGRGTRFAFYGRHCHPKIRDGWQSSIREVIVLVRRAKPLHILAEAGLSDPGKLRVENQLDSEARAYVDALWRWDAGAFL